MTFSPRVWQEQQQQGLKLELLTISDKNITDENVEDRQTLPRSLALRPGVQKRISPYQTSGRPGLALPVQEYQSARVLQYWIGMAVHLNPLSKKYIPCKTVSVYQHINILIDLICSDLFAVRNVKKVGSWICGWKELEGCQWQVAIWNGIRLMLPCRDISITSSSPALEQLMFYSVAWILSDCIEYVSSDELKIIPIGKPLNISLLKSILTKERWNLYKRTIMKPEWTSCKSQAGGTDCRGPSQSILLGQTWTLNDSITIGPFSQQHRPPYLFIFLSLTSQKEGGASILLRFPFSQTRWAPSKSFKRGFVSFFIFVF